MDCSQYSQGHHPATHWQRKVSAPAAGREHVTSSSGTIHLQLQQSHAVRTNQLFSATREVNQRWWHLLQLCRFPTLGKPVPVSQHVNIRQFTLGSTVYIWELHLFHFTYLWEVEYIVTKVVFLKEIFSHQSMNVTVITRSEVCVCLGLCLIAVRRMK